jgi:hypothetical protein
MVCGRPRRRYLDNGLNETADAGSQRTDNHTKNLTITPRRIQCLDRLINVKSSVVKGLDEQKSWKTLGIRNWTQTGKGTYTRTLCLKNEESVKIKQRSIKMGGKNIYRALSPKRTTF